MLPRKVIAGPAKEPLSLEEAKGFLRITSAAEDDVVLALVAAARKRVERGTELALLTQTVEVVLDGFWGSCALELPMPPLQGIDSIKYLDEAGVLQTLPAGTELEFVIMVIAVSCVKLLSAHNSTQHTSRKHKV